MPLKKLLEITEAFPGWESCYVQQYNRSATMRLLYRGSDVEPIPALMSDVVPLLDYCLMLLKIG